MKSLPRSLLYVEQNDELRELTALLFVHAGYIVVSCGSFTDAFDSYVEDEGHFDAVIAESAIQNEVITGLGFLNAMVSSGYSGTLILFSRDDMTALAQGLALQPALAGSFVHMVTKPFVERVITLINEVLPALPFH